MTSRQTIVFLGPQRRDRDAVDRLGLGGRWDVRFVGSDLDDEARVDLDAIADEVSAVGAVGVVGTKDRSALLASLVAERLGLPGPTPAAILACQLKHRSRERQARIVPEATPRFALLDGRRAPSFGFPLFAKPVVGRLSQGARRIDSQADLALLEQTDYADGYVELAVLAGCRADETRGYLGEELLQGAEVTLEGYVHQGLVTVIGITDSVHYLGTNSFERFEYPSVLPDERQRELGDVTERLLPGLGFDQGFFNVEFVVPHEGPARVLEVNARLASQFAPLVERCHGRSTYDALLTLAGGGDPAWSPSPPEGVAISYVMRVFADALVEAAPDPDDGLELLAAPGHRLSEQGTNDAASFRLAIFTAWGATRDEALTSCMERADRLRTAFELG